MIESIHDQLKLHRINYRRHRNRAQKKNEVLKNKIKVLKLKIQITSVIIVNAERACSTVNRSKNTLRTSLTCF